MMAAEEGRKTNSIFLVTWRFHSRRPSNRKHVATTLSKYTYVLRKILFLLKKTMLLGKVNKYVSGTNGKDFLNICLKWCLKYLTVHTVVYPSDPIGGVTNT